MEHYAGIDVSLECSSVCVVDASGKIVRLDLLDGCRIAEVAEAHQHRQQVERQVRRRLQRLELA